MNNHDINASFGADGNTSTKCLSLIYSLDTTFIQKELNVPGLIGIICFYTAIFAVGIYASWRKRKQTSEAGHSHHVMLSGRQMNEVIGVFTLAATWVGGDYINGTAEYIMTPTFGLIWCQAPIYFSLALIFSGVVFAKKMWKAGYVTMLDPFQERYGKVQTAFLYLAALFAEVSFAAIAFAVLGASLNVIVGISFLWAVIISAIVALVYTLVGGLSSVALTDVLQLSGIFFGLWLAIPFAMTHPAVTPISETAWGENSWLGGPLEGAWISNYIDTALLLFFGAVPWQLYFQRALAQKTAEKARLLSILAGFTALLAAVPAVLVGAIAASTDWNMTDYREFGTIPFPACDYPLALPLVMRFLTPTPVAVIGLGAVSAAVMSSSDSCILSSSTMFAHNIYQPLRNSLSERFNLASEASDNEIVWVLRIAMFFVGVITTVLAVTVKSIVALIILCVDFPYCILFPQLCCAIFLPSTNSYGSFIGFAIGMILRMTGGEPFMNLKPVVKYPWYDEETGVQRFPFKTMTTAISLLMIIVVSWLTRQAADRWQWCRTVDKYLFQTFQPPTDRKDKSDKEVHGQVMSKAAQLEKDGIKIDEELELLEKPIEM